MRAAVLLGSPASAASLAAQQQHRPVGHRASALRRCQLQEGAARAEEADSPPSACGEAFAEPPWRGSHSILCAAAGTAALAAGAALAVRAVARPRHRGKAGRVRLAAVGEGADVARPDEPLDFGLGSQLVVGGEAEFGKTGVLLLNIGTPASTSVEDVRDYLAAFLSDDRVIEIEPAPLKWLVLQFLLATRPQSSAKNYRRIWDPERGSPLLFHSADLAEGLQRELGDDFRVRIGMQYSQPTVDRALKELAESGVDNVILVPMFPHYASGTTGSCLAGAYRTAAELFCTPFLSVLPPFYGHPAYLSAMTQSIESVVGERGDGVDHLLFSFHGLPEAQCARTDETGTVCLRRSNCCGKLTRANRNCYRAQCYETARLLARELGLPDGKWSVGFQSRLTLRGRVQWIRPYTDEAFETLGRSGVKRLAVVAPSFTADCVETLEELGITGREEFAAAGGEELVVIPCLNSSELWVQKLSEILREHVNSQAEGLRSWAQPAPAALEAAIHPDGAKAPDKEVEEIRSRTPATAA